LEISVRTGGKTSMIKVIGITGAARSGKDSTADILAKLLNGRSCKVEMARELKYLARDYFGYKDIKDEADRKILQELGTDTIRIKLQKPLFHVKRACETIEIIQDKYDFIFCPDVRFDNEARYLQACFLDKVIFIKVERIGFNQDDNLTAKQHKHKSENALITFKDFDYIIKSETGLDKLEDEIKKVMNDFIVQYKVSSVMDTFYRQYCS
jgi:dephospho-CoA kinase